MAMFAENVLGEFCFMVFAMAFIVGMVGLYQGTVALVKYIRGK